MARASKPITAINLGPCPTGVPSDQLIEVAAAGFKGVEITLASDGLLSCESSEDVCITLAKSVQGAGLKVSGLALPERTEANFASPEENVRRRAVEEIRCAMDRAVWLGAKLVIVSPGAVGEPDSAIPLARYEEAYTRSLDSFLFLRFEAEERGVRLACRNTRCRFLLSLPEMRDFIDRINSPWFGVCLSLGEILPIGYPQDWIAGLGHRIFSIHANDFRLGTPLGGGLCRLGDGDVDWPAVTGALGSINYRGPMVYDGPAGEFTVAKEELGKAVGV